MQRKPVHGISAPCSANCDTNGFVNRRSTVQSRPLAQGSENSVTKDKDARCRAHSPHALCGTKAGPFAPAFPEKLNARLLSAGATPAEAAQLTAFTVALRADLPRVRSAVGRERVACIVARALDGEIRRLGLAVAS